jgi:RHS repeat-associated protein
VDMITKIENNATMYVAFNTGNGFTAPVEWRGSPDKYVGETKSCQRGGGLYYSHSFKLHLLPIFIIINPGVDAGWSMGRRETALMDVTGDGCPDFVQSDKDGELSVALNRVGLTNKLKSVSRPLGANFEVSYHREGNTYDMPHKRWVLSKVVLNDGHAGDGADTQVITYKYSDGKYDRLEREFYGFRKVVAEYLHPADNSLLKSVITTYLINSYYTKGMVESVETKDGNGQPFLRTVNAYRLWDVETGADLVDVYPANTIATVFPQLVRSDKYFHEGQIVAGVDTYETYEYDAYGNATRYFQAGNLGANDDVEAVITYHEDLTNYIVGKAASTRVYGNGVLMRHREGDYDTKGNQTELRQYLASGQARVTNLTYYPNGTPQQVTSPANQSGQRYAVSLVYDPLVGAYVTQITDSFGYNSTATYNYLYGAEASATDLNGNVMRKEYDNFGRLIKVFSPYDGAIPAAAFAYYPNELPARAVTQNKLYFDPANGETLDTVLFTDGLKRVIQTKKEAEVLLHGTSTPSYGMTVSGKAIFDALGRVVQQGQPVFEAGYATAFYDLPLKNPSATQYDVLDRATLVTLPDNSTMQTAYAIENSQFKTTVTDPEGNVRYSYADVRGNTVETIQFNNGETITTTYEYDPLSEIIKVIDNNGNITQMTYDLVGQRIGLNNPDRGLVEYTYDLAGNMVQKVDGNLRNKGQAINYVYEYNRLQKTNYPESIDVEYFYGAPGASDNRAGRLYKTTDASGITESFFGKLGEAVKTVRTMNFLVPGHEPWTFTTESGYDYLGRVQWLTYPDGEKLIYVYDQGGLIKGAYGERQTDHYDYVKQIAYDEFGQRVYIKYGNDIETRYTYDPYRRWLDNINTGNSLGGTLQNMHYTFDKVGNVLGLENKAQRITQSFQYDDLYQLVRAEGNGPDKHKNKHKANHYIQTFSYDTIGNMTRKTSYNQITPGNHMPKELNFDFTYLYNRTKPHAPSEIENWEYQYDDNGNTVVKSRLTGAPTGGSIPGGGTSGEYIWDEENRLSTAKVNGMSTNYLYDAGGTCTVKRGPGGETLYVSQFYQLQNRQRVTKHFFVGPTRVVSKLSHYNNPNGLYDSGYEKKNIYTYHPDHLGSANYITDPVGKQFEHIEYTPYGETWIDDGTNLNIIDYRFTSKELDKHTGLYYFGARYLDPQNSRWLSPDPILDKYMPEMPVDDDAKKRNQKLPGMGGVFNPVNMQIYHYAANNPVKYVDPDGQSADSPYGLMKPMLFGTEAGYPADTGLDISAPVGTPVFSVTSGTIVYSEFGHTRWQRKDPNTGQYIDTPFSVLIKLDNPITYKDGRSVNYVWYTHLSKLVYEKHRDDGQTIHIGQGDLIGYSGTANSSPHLHIGLIINQSQEQYPDDYFDYKEVGEMLNIKEGQSFVSEYIVTL